MRPEVVEQRVALGLAERVGLIGVAPGPREVGEGVAAGLRRRRLALLNAEAPLTMLLAAAFFREHVGRHTVAGGLRIAAGGCLLARTCGLPRADLLGAAAVVAACASWELDNNLTQRLSQRMSICRASYS